MKEKIQQIKTEALQKIDVSNTLDDLENVRIAYLGKKSAFNEILKGLKNLSSEEKKEIGPLANNTKKEIQHLIDDKKLALESVIDEKKEWIDVTAPGKKHAHGQRRECLELIHAHAHDPCAHMHDVSEI